MYGRSGFNLKHFIIFTLFFCIFSPFVLPGAPSQGLFSPVEPGNDSLSSVSGMDEPWIIRKRSAVINISKLCRYESGVDHLASNPDLGLNFFDDVRLNARIFHTEKTFSGGNSFIGDIAGIPGSEVILTVNGDIVAGNVSVPGHVYQIRYVSGSIHALLEIDRSQFPSEQTPIPVYPINDGMSTPNASVQADSGSRIDVLVVYDADARSAAGGTAAIETLIDLAVSETNTGYGNSGVIQRIRLVHTEEVVYDETGFDFSTALSRLRGTSDGYMDNVHTLRNTYGADEVVFLVKNGAYCGMAYLMTTPGSYFASSAFAVVNYSCATGYYSFAHEMGHNMGCHHDRDNASGSGSYSYSYGYQDPDEAFRTIMAYNCPGNCTRINYWSTPDKTYSGKALGVLNTEPDSADNRLSLNNTAYTVANWRTEVTPPGITVTSPNGGESWDAGSTHTISWSTTGTVGNVKIEYSSNNGSSWSTVISSTANDGSYSWTVPSTASSQCLVRISEASDSNPTDNSNAVFSITAPSSPTLSVVSPNGGESWASGSSQSITWSTTGSVGNVKIEYSSNNGSSWSTVVSSTTNNGTYSWTAPGATTSQGLIRIGEASDGSPTDTSNSVFSITGAASPTITVLSPNGGEDWEAGSSHKITWSTTGSVGNVKIQFSSDNGSNWSTVTSSTGNDGTYAWTVPSTASSKCLVRIYEAADGSPTDNSNGVFTISAPPSPTLSVTSPNGGENLEAGTSETIKWSTTGTVGNVKIMYSVNSGSSWSTIVSSTANDGTYKWTVPAVESSKCLVRVQEALNGNPTDDSDAKFAIYTPVPPEITLSRAQLNFGASTGGLVTGQQTVYLNNSGGGTLSWKASSDNTAISVSPTSGTGKGAIKVTVDPSGLAAGSYSGTISISDGNASNSPQTVSVNIAVKNTSQLNAPFGAFGAPASGKTVSSSVPVTGWVLDDIEVVSVKLYSGTTHIGNAVFVEGSRPDVEKSFPDYPLSNRAGWGYMLLSQYLPGGGNGTYTISAEATDAEGHTVSLGSTTIDVDNVNVVKPFGAIDTPDQGGEASGSGFVNWGWALTPNPNRIPTNGSTIWVFVDGKKLGNPTKYNLYRPDIEKYFPGYANSAGASGYYVLDTTTYDNGLHTIQWTVNDNAGNSDGIGSRFFLVNNSGSSSDGYQYRQLPERTSVPSKSALNVDGENNLDKFKYKPAADVSRLPVESSRPVRFNTGFNDSVPSSDVFPDEKGVIRLGLKETGRLTVNLNGAGSYSGYMVSSGKLFPLPAGSTFDRRTNTFYWMPGPGYMGDYRFVFIENDSHLESVRKIDIQVTISPR